MIAPGIDSALADRGPNAYPAPFLDPLTHTYFHDGARLLGLTTMIRDLGMRGIMFDSPGAAARGTRIHQMVAAGMAEYPGIEKECRDRATADERATADVALQAIRNLRVDWHWIEQPIADLDLGIACTPDLLGVDRRNGIPVVLELKTGAYERWHRFQTAGQAVIWKRNLASCATRLVLYAGETRASIVPHSDQDDLRVFQAMVTVAKAREGY